jgi:hypothetical protein
MKPIANSLRAALAMALAACGENKPQEPAKEEATKKDSSLVSLSDEQIGSAGIQITHPTVGGAGRLDLPDRGGSARHTGRFRRHRRAGWSRSRAIWAKACSAARCWRLLKAGKPPS